MTRKQILNTLKRLNRSGVKIEKGLSEQEFEKLELQFDIKFPPDLRNFLSNGLPVGDGFPNWRMALINKKAKEYIEWRIDGPLYGLLFDVKVNQFWFEEWGEKPSSYQQQEEVVKRCFKSYPLLIPVYSHRYIPTDPVESDNPIFSIVQTDIIYYGKTLYDYFKQEFSPSGYFKVDLTFKHIRFWSDLVELNR